MIGAKEPRGAWAGLASWEGALAGAERRSQDLREILAQERMLFALALEEAFRRRPQAAFALVGQDGLGNPKISVGFSAQRKDGSPMEIHAEEATLTMEMERLLREGSSPERLRMIASMREAVREIESLALPALARLEEVRPGEEMAAMLRRIHRGGADRIAEEIGWPEEGRRIEAERIAEAIREAGGRSGPRGI